MGHDGTRNSLPSTPDFFEVFFAKPFDVTAYADSVDYEFKIEGLRG